MAKEPKIRNIPVAPGSGPGISDARPVLPGRARFVPIDDQKRPDPGTQGRPVADDTAENSER